MLLKTQVLNNRNKQDLYQFLLHLNEDDKLYFAPHYFTIDAIDAIIKDRKQDKYFLVYSDLDEICGYCMLRGWDEGFSVPSIGLCVAKAYRGKGLSKSIISKLLVIAAEMGATTVMLKVHKSNQLAIKVYEKLGFHMQVHSKDQMIGTISLSVDVLDSLRQYLSEWQ